MVATPSLAAGLNNFVGTWKNNDSATRGIVKIVITRSGNTLKIRPYGSCHPKLCDWGVRPAIAYAPTVSSDLETNANATTVVYRPGFAVIALTLVQRGTQLSVTSFTHFTDCTRRTDYSMSASFTK